MMKPLFEEICGFLEARGWDYQPDSEQQRLILQVEGLTLVVDISENGEFVKIFLPQLLTISDDHPHYEKALETLLHLGWQYKLARWQRDPDDGEVRLQADLPLEDSELTPKQFWRTVQGTLQIAQQGWEQLRRVLETGENQPRKTQTPTLNFGVDSPALERIAFLWMLFEKILEYQGNPQQIYPILRENLHHLNTGLIPALEQNWQTLQSRETDPPNPLIPASFGEFGNLIQQFPLGNQSWNLEIAINCYQAALTVWKPDTAPLDWAGTQNNLGSAYSDLPTGDRAANLQQAIKCYQAALTVRKPDTAPLDWAGTQNNLGSAYSVLPTGDRAANLQRAIDCYQAALTVKKPDTAPLQWATTQNNLGSAYSVLPTGDRAANRQRAIHCYQAALTVWKPDTAPLQWATTQNNLGNAYTNLPTGDRAANLQQAIDCYQAALTVWKPDTAPLDWAGTQNNLGNAYTNLPTGDRATNLKRAIDCYQSALTVWKPKLFPLECLKTTRNWGNLEFNRGHWQEALTQYQVAIAAIEESRRSALSEERRQQVVQESIYVYENAIQAAINLDDIPTALEIVERVRAKRLVDLMATADLYSDGNIPAQVQQWLQQLDRLDDQIAQKRNEFKDNSGETKPDKLKTRQLRAATSVSADIAKIEGEKQAILDQIGGVDEVFAKLRQVQPPKLSDFQPLLSEKTALVSFYTTRNDTHIFILRSGESQPHCFTCKGQGYKTLQQWLRATWMMPYLSYKTQWREQMPDTLAEIARRLELNRLIKEHLQDIEELVIVPHLFLHQIPFVALPIHLPSPTGRGVGGEGFLGDKFRIRYAPSLQVLGFCHHRGQVSISNYGTAENATDDLPFSGFEGSKVAELFKIDPQRRLIGAAATRQNYRELLQQVNRLVSTHHAQSRFDNSQESGLQLSDGSISVSQLFSPGWRFPQLEEVFLSCCETGLFSPNSYIDEPVALSTGFLCAGARGVIASQWSIYDCSAALLSILYHEQRQGGLNRVRALQAAQQKMRQMTGAEFNQQYKKPVEKHLKAEEKRLLNNSPALTRVRDAKRVLKMYANDQGCPFEHPVHWGALGCYGLG
ncbi:CHAT domain-containing protein [Laspinema sp. D1]|uniref:CHAT domain-containing protein n=1 Tax=Laspinema palackyanum TaxID=3231601 RepID=UPI003482BE15|nr:CHAT domain-containing protein [Laspinema sp. D2b]